MLYENAHVAPILYHKDGAHASNVGRQPVEDNLRKACAGVQYCLLVVEQHYIGAVAWNQPVTRI